MEPGARKPTQGLDCEQLDWTPAAEVRARALAPGRRRDVRPDPIARQDRAARRPDASRAPQAAAALSYAGARAFYTLDRELRIVGASPVTLRIWSRTLPEVVGRKLADAFPHVRGTVLEDALDESLRSFRPVRITFYAQAMGRELDLEIYPMSGGLQVGFGPVD